LATSKLCGFGTKVFQKRARWLQYACTAVCDMRSALNTVASLVRRSERISVRAIKLNHLHPIK
jgi:hypothetical protein